MKQYESALNKDIQLFIAEGKLYTQEDKQFVASNEISRDWNNLLPFLIFVGWCMFLIAMMIF